MLVCVLNMKLEFGVGNVLQIEPLCKGYLSCHFVTCIVIEIIDIMTTYYFAAC